MPFHFWYVLINELLKFPWIWSGSLPPYLSSVISSNISSSQNSCLKNILKLHMRWADRKMTAQWQLQFQLHFLTNRCSRNDDFCNCSSQLKSPFLIRGKFKFVNNILHQIFNCFWLSFKTLLKIWCAYNSNTILVWVFSNLVFLAVQELIYVFQPRPVDVYPGWRCPIVKVFTLQLQFLKIPLLKDHQDTDLASQLKLQSSQFLPSALFFVDTFFPIEVYWSASYPSWTIKSPPPSKLSLSQALNQWGKTPSGTFFCFRILEWSSLESLHS